MIERRLSGAEILDGHKAPAAGAARDREAPRAGPVRVLIVNAHLPVFPGTGGHEYLNTTSLAARAARVGLVSSVHRENDLRKCTAFREAGVSLYLWESPHIGAPAAHRRGGLGDMLHRGLRGLAGWVKALPHRPREAVLADLTFRNLSAPLRAALSEDWWHAMVVVQSSAAQVSAYVPRPLASVLVMHDIRALVYDRQARVAPWGWRRFQLRREARRYFAFERHAAREYDLIIALSDTDARWIQEHYAPRRVAVVPIPVDSAYFAPVGDRLEHPHQILFTGLMNHPPNADAARFFSEAVLPLVRQRVANAAFLIVGKHPTDEVLALGRLPGVTVTGEVPDTRPHLEEAAVIVVPLRFGSGVRNKILEAWAMGKCVVSTTVGAEGLACEHGENLLIADEPAAIAEAVVRAFGEPGLRRRLGAAGRRMVVEAHAPARIAETYYRELSATVAGKARLDEPMRVALDMRWMVPGLAGGLEQLARSFLGELGAVDRFNRYVAVLPARSRHDFAFHPGGNIRAVSLDSPGAYVRQFTQRVRRSLHARLHLDDWLSPEVINLRWLRSLDAEIAYSFPGYIHPDLWPLRHVLVVPDIQHEYFPEFFAPEALAERQRLYGESIRHADHICAISEFTRRSLIERLGTPPDRITTVPLAADPIFAAAPVPSDEVTLLKYRLRPGRYLFFPAHTWHHKNHKTALKALRLLREAKGIQLELVCTGGAREGQGELDRVIAAEQLPVRFLGYCERTELPALYRQAACLVFPSLFEGFGMPVLEAMASGCPVVCSDTTSLPEIAGDAAILVDPFDPDALAEGIASVVRSPRLRRELTARGLGQAARFSWRRHTLETVRVLHRVHQGLRSV